MSENKPTPGPWRVAATDDTRVLAGKRDTICVADSVANDWREAAANARLIAAAPTMLDELRAALPIVKAAAHRERDVAKARAIKALADRIENTLAETEGRDDAP